MARIETLERYNVIYNAAIKARQTLEDTFKPGDNIAKMISDLAAPIAVTKEELELFEITVMIPGELEFIEKYRELGKNLYKIAEYYRVKADVVEKKIYLTALYEIYINIKLGKVEQAQKVVPVVSTKIVAEEIKPNEQLTANKRDKVVEDLTNEVEDLKFQLMQRKQEYEDALLKEKSDAVSKDETILRLSSEVENLQIQFAAEKQAHQESLTEVTSLQMQNATLLQYKAFFVQHLENAVAFDAKMKDEQELTDFTNKQHYN